MTSTPETAPYGAWRSPITADLITGKRVGVVSPRIDGDDVYWIENRPAEAGRSVVVRRAPDGTIADAIPADSMPVPASTSTVGARTRCATACSSSRTSPTPGSTASMAAIRRGRSRRKAHCATPT